MINYASFIVLIIINLIFFIYYIKIAEKVGFIDNSKKFGNSLTVTSAGIIFYLNLLILFIIKFFFEDNFIERLPNKFLFTLLALSLLVFVSIFDDLKSIDPKIRLIIQLICVYFSITSIPIYELNLPTKLSIFICLCIWVYILNITNFIDGSDGFLGTNTIFLFLNLAFINNFFNLDLFISEFSMFILPSIFIFIYFNKPSAKLYMGDSGSILIGFINGYIFLMLMTSGYLYLGISLLIYPLIDCSIALIKKTSKGMMPWVDTSNYSFLQPNIKKNKNKFFVFYINIIFNILNSFLILGQIFISWHIILFNILLVIIFLRIYEKKN